MTNIISFQPFLCPDIARVLDNKDYADHRRLLDHIDRILNVSGVEFRFIELSMEQFEARVQSLKATGEKALSGPDAIAR